MEILTVNQTMDRILTFMDEMKPKKAPQKLFDELTALQKTKMSHPKGGLLPYPRSVQIDKTIQALNFLEILRA